MLVIYALRANLPLGTEGYDNLVVHLVQFDVAFLLPFMQDFWLMQFEF